MAIDLVGLVVLLGAMVCLPFMVLSMAKSEGQKTLKHPDRMRWFVLTISAGEIIVSGSVLQFVMTFFLPRNQLNQLPVPAQALGIILMFIGGAGFLWAGMKLRW